MYVEEIAKLFSNMFVPFYIPTKQFMRVRVPAPLHPPHHNSMVILFNFSHSNKYAIKSHCGFVGNFLITNDAELPISHLCTFSGEKSFSIF